MVYSIVVDITWKKYEKDIQSSDPEIAQKALDAFEQERNLQTSTSKSASDWEKDRKKELQKGKAQWVKEKRKKDIVGDFSKSLRQWSGYDSMVKPCANYIIIETEDKQNKTDSGILLESNLITNNIGTCVAIGGDYVSPYNPITIKPPCCAGDKIMFKLGAGIEIEIKSKKYKFIQYSDVLGVFEDA